MQLLLLISILSLISHTATVASNELLCCFDFLRGCWVHRWHACADQGTIGQPAVIHKPQGCSLGPTSGRLWWSFDLHRLLRRGSWISSRCAHASSLTTTHSHADYSWRAFSPQRTSPRRFGLSPHAQHDGSIQEQWALDETRAQIQ